MAQVHLFPSSPGVNSLVQQFGEENQGLFEEMKSNVQRQQEVDAKSAELLLRIFDNVRANETGFDHYLDRYIRAGASSLMTRSVFGFYRQPKIYPQSSPPGLLFCASSQIPEMNDELVAQYVSRVEGPCIISCLEGETGHGFALFVWHLTRLYTIHEYANF